MRTRGIALALAAFALVGCSGGSEADSVGSAQDVADMAGCTGLVADSEELFVTEGGTCDLDGEDIAVYYFADNEARDNYVDAAAGFGGQYLVGDQWAIGAKAATLEALREDLGGTVKP